MSVYNQTNIAAIVTGVSALLAVFGIQLDQAQTETIGLLILAASVGYSQFLMR